MADQRKPKNERLHSVARDASRHVMSGARRREAAEPSPSRPYALLCGRQQPATPDELEKQDVQFQHKGVDIGAPFSRHRQNIGKTIDEVKTSLKDARFYKLCEDETPTWAFHQRSFSFPSPAPDDDRLEEEGLVTQLIPTPAVREADAGRVPDKRGATPPSPAVTLYHVKPKTADPDAIDMIPLSRESWRPATFLRCPMIPAWEEGADKHDLFELKGIRQAERWFLDQLNLLKAGSGLPPGHGLDLFLEVQETESGSLSRKHIQKWVLARRSLTRLARPGDELAAEDKEPPRPFVATDAETDRADTLRLVQMASITNRGGYVFRLVAVDDGIEFPKPPRMAAQLNLIISLKYERHNGVGANALRLPVSVNAVAVNHQADGEATAFELMEFEGPRHAQIAPYAPPGCFAFSLRREMHWPKPEYKDSLVETDDDVTRKQGFAESVHLVDVEIRSGASPNDGITLYRPRVGNIPCEDGSTGAWCGFTSAGDLASPLFPVDPASRKESNQEALPRAASGRPGIAAVAFSRTSDGTSSEPPNDPPPGHSHFYRGIVRYATTDVFARLADANARRLRVHARLRDFYGNRVIPNDGNDFIFEDTLFYTDPLIPPAEWPGIRFSMFPVATDKFKLRVEYEVPDSPAYTSADIAELRDLARLLQASAADPVNLYVWQRMPSETQALLAKINQSTSNDPIEESWRVQISSDLTTIIRGNSIHEPRRFAGVTLSRRSQQFLDIQNPTSRELRGLNRSLLDDAFAVRVHVLSAWQGPLAPSEERERLQKLQLVRDQLQGADSDVAVRLVQEGFQVSEHPTGEPDFEYDVGAVDLRAEFIRFLDEAISGGAVDPISIPFDVRRAGVEPLRMAPMLEIERTKEPYLPQPEDLLETGSDPQGDTAQELNKRIRSQVSSARSAIAFATPPASGGTAGKAQRLEFRDIARRFRLKDYQTAISRNRFNEHEIWFVGESAFPSAFASDLYEFATARPISNRHGTAKLSLPEFNRDALAEDQDWCGFPYSPKENVTHFVDIDFDDCARTFFNFVEQLMTNDAITTVERESLWHTLLDGKSLLADTLAMHLMAPLFGDTAPPNAQGVRRMAEDAYLRDLRNFYRVDTFVGLPVAGRRAAHRLGIENVYGTTEVNFQATASGAKPKLSDFVFSIRNDWPDQGHMTLAYDLPPGEESRWSEWKPDKIQVCITHLQLPTPDGVSSDDFNRGRWLEIVPPEPDAHPPVLEWRDGKAIPAILRRFPPRPVLRSVLGTQIAVDEDGLKPAQFGGCSQWGWGIRFEGDPSGQVENDTIYLAVEYPDPKPTRDETFAANEKDAKPYSSLIEALIVSKHMALAFDQVKGEARGSVNWIRAAGTLLRDIAEYLRPDEQSAMTDETSVPFDRFKIGLSIPRTCEQLDFGYVKKLALSGPPDRRDFAVDAKADEEQNLLNLLIDRVEPQRIPPRQLTIEMLLRRNDRIPERLKLDKLTMNPDLVYECGPVSWPGEVKASNGFDRIPVRITGTTGLSEVLTEIFEALFHRGVIDMVWLRVNVSHAFDIPTPTTTRTILNPIKIYPVDYPYGSASAFGETVANHYREWLQNELGNKTEVVKLLQSVNNPRLVLGFHASEKRGDDFGRKLLEIEQIVIPLKQVDILR